MSSVLKTWRWSTQIPGSCSCPSRTAEPSENARSARSHHLIEVGNLLERRGGRAVGGVLVRPRGDLVELPRGLEALVHSAQPMSLPLAHGWSHTRRHLELGGSGLREGVVSAEAPRQ